MKNLNGKIVYLVKTTDLVNSKVTQVIASLRLISRAFSVWQKQVRSFASKVTCHFNMQQEFTPSFAMEVNKALTSLLRLTEVDDLLRQIAHLTKRNLIGYADLPRFLTEEISLKLSSVDTLAPAIDALKNGFSVILNPLVDTKFPSQRKLQMYFLFLLPVLVSLNKVYNSLVDFTRHLTKLNSDIASVKEVPDSGISDTLVYFSLALTVFDLIIVLVFYCVLSKRVSVPRTTSAATSV